jgi:hypothetical protein
MIALADSMNVSIGALRNMAAEGKLTTDVIVNGLLSQGDKIGQEFAKTTATISQSLEIANNNITKFFGENATVKTGVKIFSDSVISLSENLDVLSTTLTIVAGVMGARYVGALTMATSAKIADIAASRQQVVADNQTAQAALVAANSVQRKALADKEAALSSLALAQAEYNVAKVALQRCWQWMLLWPQKLGLLPHLLLLLRLKLPRLQRRPVRRQLLVQRPLVSEWLVVRLLL